MKKHVPLPQRITCRVTYNGLPIVGLMLWIDFEMIKKNPYTIIFGPTDNDGNAFIEKNKIIRETDEQFKISMMDYEKIEVAYSGKFEIEVMSADDIKGAIQAYEMYKKFSKFPENYRNNLEKAYSVISNLQMEKIMLTINEGYLEES